MTDDLSLSSTSETHIALGPQPIEHNLLPIKNRHQQSRICRRQRAATINFVTTLQKMDAQRALLLTTTTDLRTHGSYLQSVTRFFPSKPAHDTQVKLLPRDLPKAARHPVVEETPVGRHTERPDIRALGRCRGTELFDVAICHPLSRARIPDMYENPLSLFKGGMDCQCFQIRQHAPSGRNSVQPAPCSVVNTRHGISVVLATKTKNKKPSSRKQMRMFAY